MHKTLTGWKSLLEPMNRLFEMCDMFALALTSGVRVQAALDKEIRETLASWKGLLGQADRIFVQASISNAAPIFGGDNPALSRSDSRIRSIPIATRWALSLSVREMKPLHTLLIVDLPCAAGFMHEVTDVNCFHCYRYTLTVGVVLQCVSVTMFHARACRL